MRCTNKITKHVVVMLLVGSTLLSGCAKKDIEMEYIPDYPVSSYRIVNRNSFEVADSFAADLCVTTTDVVTDTEVNIEATAAGLFNLNSGEVIYAKNIHSTLQPASLTKIMTALVALKYGNPEDVITASANVRINEVGAQVCGIEEGDQLTLDQALHALLMHSGNDAGILIAEHIGGSVEGFADMMNEEALAIGATNSHFVNPHGLTADNHFVTAYDMYLIFNEAVKFDLINEIIHMNTYSTVYTDKNGDSVEMSFDTTNLFLNGTYDAPEKVTIIGGKTGTTNAAGNCLILLSKDISGNPYISVILRSKERAIIYSEMTDLLDEIYN